MGLKLENYLVCQGSRINPQRAKAPTNMGQGAMPHDIGTTNSTKRWSSDTNLQAMSRPP